MFTLLAVIMVLVCRVSSKCDVGYNYKVFNTPSTAPEALTICRAHGATIITEVQLKNVKRQPKSTWVRHGNNLFVHTKEGKVNKKVNKAAFICAVQDKEGCGVIICHDSKCTPIGEVKKTKIEGSKVYLTTHDGHHYRAKDILFVSGKTTKNCILNKKSKTYKCTTVKGKAPKQKKCFIAKDKAKICVRELGYVDVAKCNIKTVKDKKKRVGSADIKCLTQRVCVRSEKLSGLLCTSGKSRKVMCFLAAKGKTKCWKIQDITKLKYTLWCKKSSKKLKCKIVIDAICMKSGKCQHVGAPLVTKPGTSAVSRYSNKTCARLIILHLGISRLNVYCKRHKKNEITCKLNAKAGGVAKKIAIKRKKGCEVPKNLVECRLGQTEANDCQIKVEKCKGFKQHQKRSNCFRQIYARCISVIYAVKHYCDKKSLDVKLSAECVGVEQKELKCYLYYKECQTAKTKREKKECERDLELECAEVSLVYLQCFFDKHDNKSTGGGKKGIKGKKG